MPAQRLLYGKLQGPLTPYVYMCGYIYVSLFMYSANKHLDPALLSLSLSLSLTLCASLSVYVYTHGTRNNFLSENDAHSFIPLGLQVKKNGTYFGA